MERLPVEVDTSDEELLPHAPEDLTRGKLKRLGEGVGKVVYASEHWVVKRQRSPAEVIAIILLWNLVRRVKKVLPRRLGAWLFDRPSKLIRFLRVLVHAGMLIVPRSLWFTRHIRGAWRAYYVSDSRGERLAREHLAGTSLIPRRVIFPPTEVHVGGWPGWLTVSEATERVEGTLHERLLRLCRQRRFEEAETWLERFLELRQSGWRRGLFSVDAHLKNFGVCGDRVVLLDTGGLTNRWEDVAGRLSVEDSILQPHVKLGLGPMLAKRPDISRRFNERWKAIVNPEVVRTHWPE